ncbi:MAG: hypothetical protein EOP56_14555 [Sphingobacteriales bacterium]|nr:MAG: hypothetical protein EOP56_14555 [Sphingobacteriales bacterium]
MKQFIFKSFAALAIFGFAACNNETKTETSVSDIKGENTNEKLETGMEVSSDFDPSVTYTDLTTGQGIHLKRDDNGAIVNLETGAPVEFYVDMSTQDTFYGKTGAEVNNALLYTNGVYTIDEARMNGDYKETMEGDEYKFKSGDTKIKSTDDEYKYKSGDTKIKINEDETKIKTGNMKIKQENGKTEIKAD